MPSIDLNSDLGEVWNGYPTADDESMFALISSASIACGLHAGDDASMRASAERAVRFGVAVGAHPSYDDRAGFGRRDQDPSDVRALVAVQLGALARAGADIRYVKPHGALYNRIVTDTHQARGVVSAVSDFAISVGRPVPLLGLGGAIAAEATAAGLTFVGEAFLDRAYTPEGTLVPRSQPGSVLEHAEHVAERALRLVRDGVIDAVDGSPVRVDAGSLCVHGDTPAAVAMAASVREALIAEGITIAAPW